MNGLAAQRLSTLGLQAVLFDLDGTLLDTAADISTALNCALAEQQLAHLGLAEVRTLIGRGVPTLVARASARLEARGQRPDGARLLERFHFHYERLQASAELATTAYPGVAEGLAQLHVLGLRLAVVTNKPQSLAVDVLRRFELDRCIDVVIGGDVVSHRKPHPLPLLTACERLAVPPPRALMVGDSMIDVLAARAAGLPVVCVPYGYNEGADPRALPCDMIVESIAALATLLSTAEGAPGVGR